MSSSGSVVSASTRVESVSVTSASGMTRWGMLSPLLRLGVYVVIANLAINLFVQPISYREMRRSLYDLRSDVASSLVTPGAFSRIGEGVTIYARERTRDGRLLDIMIHDTRGQDGAVTYTAREGVIARGGNRTALVLINGNAQWLDENQEMNYTTFDRTEPDLEEFSGIADAIFFKESDRFLHELIWPDAGTIARTGGPERAWAEAHYRLSAPLYNIAFALIAAAAFLAGDHSRMGHSRRVMIAVVKRVKVTSVITLQLVNMAIC
ncbi:LptF/LptG family permease [Acinetobacter venetianus]|uniref:LptF/LptG family permease n=1 Tax=Acinetobacter venetianus TaxID=52133 RepID=UPI0035BE5B6A